MEMMDSSDFAVHPLFFEVVHIIICAITLWLVFVEEHNEPSPVDSRWTMLHETMEHVLPFLSPADRMACSSLDKGALKQVERYCEHVFRQIEVRHAVDDQFRQRCLDHFGIPQKRWISFFFTIRSIPYRCMLWASLLRTPLYAFPATKGSMTLSPSENRIAITSGAMVDAWVVAQKKQVCTLQHDAWLQFTVWLNENQILTCCRSKIHIWTGPTVAANASSSAAAAAVTDDSGKQAWTQRTVYESDKGIMEAWALDQGRLLFLTCTEILLVNSDSIFEIEVHSLDLKTKAVKQLFRFEMDRLGLQGPLCRFRLCVCDNCLLVLQADFSLGLLIGRPTTRQLHQQVKGSAVRIYDLDTAKLVQHCEPDFTTTWQDSSNRSNTFSTISQKGQDDRRTISGVARDKGRFYTCWSFQAQLGPLSLPDIVAISYPCVYLQDFGDN